MASHRVEQEPTVNPAPSPEVAALTQQIRGLLGATTRLANEIDRTVSDLSSYVERRPRKWVGNE